MAFQVGSHYIYFISILWWFLSVLLLFYFLLGRILFDLKNVILSSLIDQDITILLHNCSTRIKSHSDTFPLGFDMEWPFNFQTGPEKTAVIQLSPSFTECHILHVSKMLKIPSGLYELLALPNVRLVGVNIRK